ncbi:alpha-L-arabinofuranosidase C-terminal domain-containing protein [Chitinophaga ginsengisegetis]|uniref:alpha-L-arabinofuranosidase C-terminal domain-containing protein n=1 Tax=Chitinophaga ginsengisegetis TaxID=393003 RepID=UPI000DBF8EB2|nr:alpha-L-arabinofuranosidase C-terminal domain-containing protein [Chitinophaga ginsengisegetis]MDR6568345.1 alpha-L-arabinofuranosidase [Chitinophaga ginsengisegetis]MDR6648424.1 alpha-L-arabinofuranosidase [Chitinophaga ginsengisegetis]MDR6654426.1 alpha-L-arabinofuranosidase [Chitinophaga ginsengisegetis]
MKAQRIIAAFTMLMGVYTIPLAAQQPLNFTVKAGEIKTPVSPNMWGIFFEDINLSADGGIYAELVKNRSFEFSTPLMGWSIPKDAVSNGQILVLNRKEEHPSNPRFARITMPATRSFEIVNEGFRGMGIKAGEQYNFSLYARQQEGAAVKLTVTLLDDAGKEIGSTTVAPNGSSWQQYKASFTATAAAAKGKLKVTFNGQGVIDVDMISLFPQHTWKERSNGLRADLVQLLADLHPGFIRFPGGCIVEGRELVNRYQWKKTVGDVNDRELIINRWNNEFAHRATPDYFQSFGLGFFEYFQLSEDIGASPLPILNCGMACQFNSAEVVAVNELDPYIQDALDLIEFANGDVNTKWGALRAKMGHPAPFNLKMMGVGNEQWGPQYVERYTIFAKAIKSKYPDIKLVNSLGPGPDGDKFTFLNDTLRKLNADILDEHYYSSPEWFLSNAARYDSYDRKGPKIFAGEYAAHTKGVNNGENKNNWQSALAEAAFMTGLERNADLVVMASYAPLLAHVDGWQWSPDLIWFDNLRSYGTPNYYVQKLYANNKGTDVVPMLKGNQVISGQDSVYASTVVDKATGELVIKLINTAATVKPVAVAVQGVKSIAANGRLITLGSNDLQGLNSLDQPTSISPEEKNIDIKGKTIRTDIAPWSFYVIRVKINK